MNTHTNAKVTEDSRVGIGDLLLAQPFWIQEDFKRSVILILDHDEKGSKGVILNKISNVVVHDALPQFNLYHPLFYGGCAKVEEISFIHNFQSLPNVLALGNGLYFGGEPETLETMIHTNMLNSSSVKFCSGFVEWSTGELEIELQEKKWWKADINAEELFTTPYERLWSVKLLNSGHLYGIFYENEDPYLN